jgi:SAM-dependent methyltransferase
MHPFPRSEVRTLLRCPACRVPSLEDSEAGLSCTSCRRQYSIDKGVIDLRISDSNQYAHPFYASSYFRVFAEKHALLHQEHYRPGSLSNWIESSMKRALQSLRTNSNSLVLELGCGGTPMADWGGHPDGYVGLDQSVELLQRAKSAHPGATFIAAELHCLPFVDRCLPIVIANAVLEHVFRLEISVEEIARCLSVDGYFYALAPTEGGFVAELARSVTSRRNARILGLSTDECIKAQSTDHCNSVFAIGNALKKHFQFDQTRYWPFLIGGANINLAKMWKARPLCANNIQ